MRSWLARHWDILTYKATGAAASQDGVLLWDAAGPYPVVSIAGEWVPLCLCDGPAAGTNAGASFTLAATAGKAIHLTVGGAWGNDTSAQTVTLNYNGIDVASHPLKQATTDDRTGISLTATVTAVASATVSVTVTGGTLYNPTISWIVI